MQATRASRAQTQTKSAPATTPSAGPTKAAASPAGKAPLYTAVPAIRLNTPAAETSHADVPAPVKQLVSAPGSGEPLRPDMQNTFQNSLGFDVASVRVHTDQRSASVADNLNARAFTYGPNIFLGSRERPTDLPLMAHEVTHVIQQQGASALQMSSAMAIPDAFEQEAHQTSLAVQRGEQVRVKGRTTAPVIQREEKEEGGGGLIGRFLDKVSDWVKRIPGYDLLTVILGKDPISGKTVERNAINVIKGLVSLIPGGHDLFENLQKSGAIQRAYDWFNQEISKLNLTWAAIKELIRQFWDAFSIRHLIRSIERIGELIGPPLTRLLNFVKAAGSKILEFIFEGILSLAGGFGQQIIGIIRKAGEVFSLIVKHPLIFLGNLIQAIKGGFSNFWHNIVKHLKNALLSWLFGALEGSGLTLPEKLDFKGILSIILQILGFTYTRLRGKLVQLIGEPAVAFLEKTFEFLKILVTQGIPAAWQKILEFAGNLADTVLEGIRNWVAQTVVGAAIQKLITMFNPVGAIIQGIITIYNTIVFFIERAKQIAAVVNAIFNSIANIAYGKLTAAIESVEKTMANTLPVIISFLARFIGLGNVGTQIKKIIQGIQAKVDAAITKVVNFIAEKGKALFGKGKDAKPDERTLEQKQQDLNKALAEADGLVQNDKISDDEIKKQLLKIKSKYRMSALEFVIDSQDKTSEIVHVRGAINPPGQTPAKRRSKSAIGIIDYGSIDRKGRRSGIHAVITKAMIGTGTPASVSAPGYGGEAANHARGHLLGKQLGGSGDIPENIVTLVHRPVNTPMMSTLEGDVRKAVEAGEIVAYSVIPVYTANEEIPTSIIMTAKGDQGRFKLSVTLQNKQP